MFWGPSSYCALASSPCIHLQMTVKRIHCTPVKGTLIVHRVPVTAAVVGHIQTLSLLIAKTYLFSGVLGCMMSLDCALFMVSF